MGFWFGYVVIAVMILLGMGVIGGVGQFELLLWMVLAVGGGIAASWRRRRLRRTVN